MFACLFARYEARSYVYIVVGSECRAIEVPEFLLHKAITKKENTMGARGYTADVQAWLALHNNNARDIRYCPLVVNTTYI